MPQGENRRLVNDGRLIAPEDRLALTLRYQFPRLHPDAQAETSAVANRAAGADNDSI
jgi:hypothetical protein